MDNQNLELNLIAYIVYSYQEERNPMGRSHTRNNRKVQSSSNTGGIISKVGNNIEPNNNDHVNTAKKNRKNVRSTAEQAQEQINDHLNEQLQVQEQI
ncbi:hypothetical protein BLOT_001469 [Blomia tropicalis]|nr:hypothetical protein BLOT_001469 [Blomia tropicalis]